jgi:hypothetical protein
MGKVYDRDVAIESDEWPSGNAPLGRVSYKAPDELSYGDDFSVEEAVLIGQDLFDVCTGANVAVAYGLNDSQSLDAQFRALMGNSLLRAGSPCGV